MRFWEVSRLSTTLRPLPTAFLPRHKGARLLRREWSTHWCGPGGAGPVLSPLDSACKTHDECYDANGFTSWSNFNVFMSKAQENALRACNQALCTAAQKAGGAGDLVANVTHIAFRRTTNPFGKSFGAGGHNKYEKVCNDSCRNRICGSDPLGHFCICHIQP
jgi:hypothetical protein